MLMVTTDEDTATLTEKHKTENRSSTNVQILCSSFECSCTCHCTVKLYHSCCCYCCCTSIFLFNVTWVLALVLRASRMLLDLRSEKSLRQCSLLAVSWVMIANELIRLPELHSLILHSCKNTQKTPPDVDLSLQDLLQSLTFEITPIDNVQLHCPHDNIVGNRFV